MARVIQSVSLDLESAAFADRVDNFSAFVRQCVRLHERYAKIAEVDREALKWKCTAMRMHRYGEQMADALIFINSQLNDPIAFHDGLSAEDQFLTLMWKGEEE